MYACELCIDPQERGITIMSKATRVDWNGYTLNIVDTPGTPSQLSSTRCYLFDLPLTFTVSLYRFSLPLFLFLS